MKIILTEEVIRERVRELGAEITRFYEGKKEPLMAVAVLNGGMFFCTDLVRAITLPEVMVDSIAVSSYHHDVSTGVLNFVKETKLPVTGKNVLLVDDVLDSGVTLKGCVERMLQAGAKSVKTAVFARKKLALPPKYDADWIGFEAPDQYLVGYGLDSEEFCRNLPYLSVKE